MSSPDGSRTASLLHGVSRSRWLFSDQLNPSPLSETTLPKCAFASTLHQGAGGFEPGPMLMTYSRPSALKPPTPLKYARLCGGVAAEPFCAPRRRTTGKRSGNVTASEARRSCCDSEPAEARSTTRAARRQEA